MINAIIQDQGGKTLIWEFPNNIYKLGSQLREMGIDQWIERISIADDEDSPISVKLYADNDVGNHLILLLSEDHTLYDVQNITESVTNSNESIKADLERNIIYDQYSSPDELYQDIRQMTYDIGAVSETFYFPLSAEMWDEEYDENCSIGKARLLSYKDDIRDALIKYIGNEPPNMAEYYGGIGKDKLLLSDWDVEQIGDELYGKVDVRLTEPMTAEENEALKDWISGQNSDGLGEGFEQQDIPIGDDILNVSFWNSGADYFIYDQHEMDNYLNSGQKMSGI